MYFNIHLQITHYLQFAITADTITLIKKEDNNRLTHMFTCYRGLDTDRFTQFVPRSSSEVVKSTVDADGFDGSEADGFDDLVFQALFMN